VTDRHHAATDDLATAAERAGVLCSYTDVDGRTVQVDRQVVQHVVDVLGDPRDQPAHEVVVAWDGQLVERFDGSERDTMVVVDDEGRHLPIDRPLPLGYHRLLRNDEVVGTVISAPSQAPAAPRWQWGTFLPLHALRTAATDGIAHYSELHDVFDWLHHHGGTVHLTLPLLPTYLDAPADWSPYSPVTRRAWSELYVDLRELDPGPWHDDEPVPQPVDGLLDYPALHHQHTARLDRVARRMADDPALANWLLDHPLATTYARFRGAQAVLGRNFRTWTLGREAALAAADPVVTRRHLVGGWLADRQLASVADRARSRGQMLGLDLALGTHADGFDVWHEADLYVAGVSVGAPPDPIFFGGQDWGFPPAHPARSRATGHRYLRDTLRHHLQHAGILRIDHVMGMARQWWVPAGHDATHGTYVRYPLDELLAVACLEAHLAGAVLVGENLGTVPPEVDQGMADHGLLGIRVGLDALRAFGTSGRRAAPPGTLATLSTHDSVPFASFWHGGDIERAHAMGLVDDHDADQQQRVRGDERQRVVETLVADRRLASHDAGLRDIMSAVVDDLGSQPADIVVINMEDLWLETRAQNCPGTFQEQPNWRRVADRTLESVAADISVSAVVDRLRQARSDARRAE
jgi:4-alpha-glucanotransferase